MRKLAISVGYIIFFLAGSTVANAATGSASDRVVDAAFEIVVPVIGMVVLWLVHRIIRLFEQRTGVDVPERVEGMIDHWVGMGIHYAEEKARQAAKDSTKKGLHGHQKLEVAVAFVSELVDQYGVEKVARERIVKLVEAKLNSYRPQ